jgi:hypothetical protein
MGEAMSRANGMPRTALSDWDFRSGGDLRAARLSRYPGGQDKRGEETTLPGLPKANQVGRCADCRRLSCWH